MAGVWLHSALWLGLAFLASLISIRVAISVALIEIVLGAVAGNLVDLQITDWVNFLAGFGAILLTFLAGTEIDPRIVRKHFWSSSTIGVVGFAAPYMGVLAYAHWGLAWPWPQAQIAGISLSTTSVAVVYAVMIETGFNKTEIGKIILAACFINDLGTVLALGIVFAHYDLRLLVFGGVTAGVLVALWLFAPAMFRSLGARVSEPQTKFVALVLLALGGLASIAGSEAVLPAYLVGMTLAPTFLREPELPHRMRIIAFSILTPFYFLKAGSLVEAHAVTAAAVAKRVCSSLCWARNDLREGPQSTGSSRLRSFPSWARISEFCSLRFPNPMPGSITMRSRAMPAARAASTRRDKSRRTSVATSSYSACAYMSDDRPRVCMRTTSALRRATTRASLKPR